MVNSSDVSAQYIYTNNQHYADIANATRRKARLSQKMKPSDMASLIRTIDSAQKYKNPPQFSCLSDAYEFYDGKYGDGMFWYGGYMIGIRPTGWTTTFSASSVAYEYIAQDTVGASTPMCNPIVHINKAATGTWPMSFGGVLKNTKYAAFPNISMVKAGGSTQNMTTWNLEQISFDTVQCISNYAFRGDGGGKLKSVYAPICERTGSDAFCASPSLETVYMPNLKIASHYAFANCPLLSQFDGSSLISIYDAAFRSTAIKSMYANNAITINQYAFSACSQLSVVQINRASVINYRTFINCSALRSVYASSASQMANGNALFANCVNLQTVHFPLMTKFTSWGDAFAEVTTLKDVDLGSLATNDYANGANVFERQHSLLSVKLGTINMYSTSGLTVSKYISTSTIVPPWFAQKYSTMTSFATITNHANNVIADITMRTPQSSLATVSGTYVQLSKMLSTFYGAIKTSAYGGSTYEMKTQMFPRRYFLAMNGATVTDVQTVYANIEMLSIPAIKSIVSSAFYDNRGIKNVYLRDVVSIGEKAFYECTHMNKVMIDASVPPTLVSIDAFDFAGSLGAKGENKVAVPNEYLQTYRQANVWSQLTNLVGY